MVDHLLIRHAHAGRRGTTDEDHLRPLSDRGRRQADAIAEQLRDAGIGAIHSSPFVRCAETVEPLAASLSLPVQITEQLAEGNGARWLLDLLEAAPAPVACCSHGDVLGAALAALERRGVPLDDDRCQKGSVWTVRVEDGTVVAARYTPPPNRGTGD